MSRPLSCSLFTALIAALLTAYVAPVYAQTSPDADVPGAQALVPVGPLAAAAIAAKTKAAMPKKGPKPYDEVITKDAKTEIGLFTVHRIDDKVYFEIPAAALGKEMLWVTEIEQLSAGAGYGGTAVGDRVVRWTRRDNTVYLQNVDYSIRADDKLAVHQAVADASLEPIIMAFDVEAEGKGDAGGKNKSAVIDVTRLMTSDVSEFSAKDALGAGSPDATRSYVQSIKAFPKNIETKSLMTFGPPPPSPFSFLFGGNTSTSVSAVIHYSMVLLPEKPMPGRLFDSRVGYFTEDFQDYGSDEHRALDRHYISRFRLEKKDPAAALSEPVQPIVFYIGREVPEKWKPYLRKAVEAWNPAFEQAGFKNAIIAKDAPTVTEDPAWDPDDARYNVIRWAPQEVENAMGPHVADPRSGEVLEAHIIVWHDVMKLAEEWYLVQAGAQDPQARHLPLPDDLEGRLLQYIVTHEVGHTLGLRHNFKASSSYSIAQLRDPKFTAENGDEASIMDYGRFNYVAQPGDHARLIPTIGPYDKFAIHWGYEPIPTAGTPDDEKPILNELAAQQVTNPMLRFGGRLEEGYNEDPTQRTEDLGDDPIQATALGLRNIARATDLLIPATTKTGEDYDRLSEMYDVLLDQRQTEMGQVAALIGGVAQTDYHVGYGDTVFKPVPRARQEKAMRFLLAYGFTTPHDVIRPSILYRIEPSGVAARVRGLQSSLLTSLLTDARIRRLSDAEVIDAAQAYPVASMVADLQNGIWRELGQSHPKIDLYRRNLQRSYLQTMKGKLIGSAATTTELRPVSADLLAQLGARIDHRLPAVTDPATRAHLRDCRVTISRILSAQYTADGSGGGSSLFDLLFGIKSETMARAVFAKLGLPLSDITQETGRSPILKPGTFAPMPCWNEKPKATTGNE